MKKILAILLAASMLLSATACNNNVKEEVKETKATTVSVTEPPATTPPPPPDIPKESVLGFWACSEDKCDTDSIMGHSLLCSLYLDEKGRFAAPYFDEDGGSYSILGDTVTLTWDSEEVKVPVTFTLDGQLLVLEDDDNFNVKLERKTNSESSIEEVVNVVGENVDSVIEIINEDPEIETEVKNALVFRPEVATFAEFLTTEGDEWEIQPFSTHLPSTIVFRADGTASGDRALNPDNAMGSERVDCEFTWEVIDDASMSVHFNAPVVLGGYPELARTLVLTNDIGVTHRLEVREWEYRNAIRGTVDICKGSFVPRHSSHPFTLIRNWPPTYIESRYGMFDSSSADIDFEAAATAVGVIAILLGAAFLVSIDDSPGELQSIYRQQKAEEEARMDANYKATHHTDADLIYGGQVIRIYYVDGVRYVQKCSNSSCVCQKY